MLTEIVIPNNVTSLGNSAFEADKIVTYQLPAGITTIPDSLFCNNKIEEVIIPDTVKTIGSYSFRQNSINTLVLPEGLQTINRGAFIQNDLRNFTIPSTVYSIGAAAFNQNKNCSYGYVYARKSHGVEDPTTVVSYCGKHADITGYTVPDGVENIGSYAFSHPLQNGGMANSLLELNLPPSVKYIGTGAFTNNYFEEIYLPEGVVSVDFAAFSMSNFYIQNIHLPSTLIELSSSAFFLADRVSIMGDCTRFDINSKFSNEPEILCNYYAPLATSKCYEYENNYGYEIAGYKSNTECDRKHITIENGERKFFIPYVVMSWDGYYHSTNRSLNYKTISNLASHNISKIVIPKEIEHIETDGESEITMTFEIRGECNRFDVDWEYYYPNVTLVCE